MTIRGLLVLVCTVLALSACGTDRAAVPSASGAESARPVPAPDPPAPQRDSTRVQQSKQRGEWDLVLTDVRTGRHDGFDRVVLDLDGSGVPGWRVEYVEQAVTEGSGDVVELGGDAVLQVFASGTTYPVEGGPATTVRAACR